MFNVFHCDGWDFTIGEVMGGGTCIGSYHTKEEAIERAQSWARVSREMWGPGAVVVTDDQHDLVAIVSDEAPDLVIKRLEMAAAA